MYGEEIGYCGVPCPNCGRYRLILYENGHQVCEKCEWCPQEGRYVMHEEIFGEEQDWHIT